MPDASLISPATVAWGAFALALVFGFVANKTSFCTMGAISDVVNMGDWSRMRMWALAVAVAMLGTTALQTTGLFSVSDTLYTGSRLIWLGHLVGGVLFGVGMTLASGCGNKTLVRIGGGNLKSLVVFVFFAISAYMTLRGLFAVWRMNLLDPVAIQLSTTQDLPSLAARSGVDIHIARLGLTAAIAGALLVFALIRPESRTLDVILGGVVIGGLTVAGWYLTGVAGYVAEHPETLERAFIGTNSGRAESFTFVAPIAYTLELLLLWSDSSRIVTFGIATVLGVIVGSAAYALISRSFRIESFHDAGDMGRHIIGAILMGFGGVTALGCTIGQGLSGLSTLALGSFLTTLAIIAGCAMTLKAQYWWMMRE